jgi:hypothetical protein
LNSYEIFYDSARKRWPFNTGDWPLKSGWIHMKFSMIIQEKGDCLIEVTAWAGLAVFYCMDSNIYMRNPGNSRLLTGF